MPGKVHYKSYINRIFTIHGCIHFLGSFEPSLVIYYGYRFHIASCGIRAQWPSERRTRLWRVEKCHKSMKIHVNISKWTELKYLCYMNPECEGFTLSSGFKCTLHKTAKVVHFTQRRISQIGIRNRTSTIPKYCEEEQRLERCKKEPKCKDVLNCFRNGYFK